MSPIVDHLGDIARERGEFGRAFDYYRQSMPHWLVLRDPQGGADSLVGAAISLERLGHVEAAVEIFGAVTAAYRSLGMARIRYGPGYSEELIEKLRRELGRERFESRWAEGERSGWERVTRATIERIVEPVAVADPSPASTGFGLTPREEQILDLLVEGRSNAEIGDRLFICARTVGTHLANVFSKLDVNNRSAAVGVAMRARERARSAPSVS